MSETQTTPFTGPHGSFWVVCADCEGRGWLSAGHDCGDDEWCDGEDGDAEDCDRCHGNGGYWDCVDDLCAALIDEWNTPW